MSSKVLFISTWINNPDFIPIQRDLIKKFCKEEADLLCVLDGKDDVSDFTNEGHTNIRKEMIDICKKNDINFIEVPKELHQQPLRNTLFPSFLYNDTYSTRHLDPSSRTAVSNQLGYNTFHKYLSHYRYLVMIQSDVFPFKEFSVVDMLDGNSLLYKNQVRETNDKKHTISHAWDGFLFFDFMVDKSINWNTFSFDTGHTGINKNIFTDTGGATWYILEKILQKKKISSKDSLQWSLSDPYIDTLPQPIQNFCCCDIRNKDGNIFSEIMNDNFIHLRGGGNWEFINSNEAEWLKKQNTRFNMFKHTCLQLLL